MVGTILNLPRSAKRSILLFLSLSQRTLYISATGMERGTIEGGDFVLIEGNDREDRRLMYLQEKKV